MTPIVATSIFESLNLPVDVTVETFVLTIAMMGIIMFGMALGVIFRGKELKGSCGGKGGEECYCDKKGIPRRCEQLGKPKSAH